MSKSASDLIRAFRESTHQHRAETDAVLADLDPPGENKIPGCPRYSIGRIAVGARLITRSGHGQAGDRCRSAEAGGFDHHLVKPVNLTMLSTVIGSAAGSIELPLAGKSVACGGVQPKNTPVESQEYGRIWRFTCRKATQTTMPDTPPKRVAGLTIALTAAGLCLACIAAACHHALRES